MNAITRPTLMSVSFRRVQRLTALLPVLALGACQSDRVLAPDEALAASVDLTMQGSASLASLGDTARIVPVVRASNGDVLRNVPLAWSLSRADVLAPAGNGAYRAIGNGRVVITAVVDPSATGVRPGGYYASRLADSIVVDVQQQAARVVTTAFDSSFTMIGLERPWQITLSDARGNALPRPTGLRFETANPLVATVDSTGTVRATGEGRTIISVSVNGVRLGTGIAVNPRTMHVSCMVYSQRRRAKEQCVTNAFVLHAPRGGSK